VGEVRGTDGTRGKWQHYETRDGVLACACCLVVEVQFGHAGAQVGGDLETAASKNKDMKESGIHVPESYFSKVFSNRCRYLVQPYRTLDTVNES